MNRAISLIATCLTSTALMTGCGTDGTSTAGVGSGGTGSSVALEVSGKVADGYLAGAIVFLDRNGNYQKDPGEPSTATDATGSYVLEIDPADVAAHPIVVHAIKAITVDRDTDQPLASSYVLSLPKEGVDGTTSNFISPLTSQVREMMETGEYASLQQASDALRSRLGLPAGTDLMGDYLSSNNTAVHAVAKNMATVMGGQMDLMLGTDGQAISVDVNRYRGMMGTMFNDLSSNWSQYPKTGMSTFNAALSNMLSGTLMTPTGQPYWNMSTAYRNMTGGMTGR